MNCKRCGTEMDDGEAMVPVWGNHSNRIGAGAILYPVTAVLRAVKKCTNCGYSVSFEGVIHGAIREVPVETRRVVVVDAPAMEAA